MIDKKTLTTSPELIEDLKEKHGEILEILTVEGPVVIRVPTRAEYRRFQSDLFDDRKKAVAQDNLVAVCVVSPAGPEFAGMADRRPGIVGTIASKLLEFAGLEQDADTKKY